MRCLSRLLVIARLALWLLAPTAVAHAAGGFTLPRALDYPYDGELTSAQRGPVIAWVRNLGGVRNIWIARGSGFPPARVTNYKDDDGQELTQPTFSPDGRVLVYVRGGDHDANWPATGNLPPDPDSSTATPEVAIWRASLSGGQPVRLAAGDAPAISAHGVLAFVRDGQVWTTPLDGNGKPSRLFFDRGHDGELTWSPDGSALAFTSDRGDHAFIGIYRPQTARITWLAPSTGRDFSPRWSPDGKAVAFVRAQGDGGPPEPWLHDAPHPFAIWTADPMSGDGREIWRSPPTNEGSIPDVAGGVNLNWAAGERLIFLAELDGWEHLYSLPVTGGSPLLLTPGRYMVEHVGLGADKRSVIYSANTGDTVDDGDRRHLFSTPVDVALPVQLTRGDTLEWSPTPVSDGHIAFIESGVRTPPGVALTDSGGAGLRRLNDGAPPVDFAGDQFITPRAVSFTAADGTVVHGQIFRSQEATERQPGLIFVHGGPPRQMLLGWHYMEYYSNGYAVNQYLAAHGFTVLTVNYRLGIGYGRAFQHPENAGPQGAAEYQDVVAGARYLQSLPGVDGGRIGIWGGSYGGYLTGLALARNSEIFKAGVDLHGVHDWSREIAREAPDPNRRFEQGDRAAAMATAFTASPDADIATWRSPVLLIQGDDDRNVDFQQTVDLARRLDARGIRYEELVLPDEIHGFLRHTSWLKADMATAAFLARELNSAQAAGAKAGDSGLGSKTP